MIPGQDPDVRAPPLRAACIREVSIQLQPQAAGSRKSGSFLVRQACIRAPSRPCVLGAQLNALCIRPKLDVSVYGRIDGVTRGMYLSLSSVQAGCASLSARKPVSTTCCCLALVTCAHHRLRPIRFRSIGRSIFFWRVCAAEPLMCNLPARASGEEACAQGEDGGGDAARGGARVGLRGISSSQRRGGKYFSGMYCF